METIRVNMNPNPLDVQTIHASQNDGEARQWGFELHNNGDVIDSSEVTDQITFKAYEGGTEEILPTNGSTPTTSPIIADIKYPQGELTDQEFLYRESPTEENGLAKITDIKGNTLVWNQLYKNVNISTSQTKNGVTLTNNNDGSWALSGTASANTFFYGRNGDIKPILGHKYLLKDCVPNGVNQFYCVYGNVEIRTAQNNSIVTATSTSAGNGTAFQILNGVTVDVTFRPQIFDLTAMGLDSLTVEEFTSLFSLPYYAYNQGTLLSFNGNGIKTTNADETEESTLSLPISTYFPNGMKSKGTVYDELTESKAITRIGSRAYQSGDESDTSVITDGTTTYYVLATPIETSFTTASLVTENAEIPLSNEDGVLVGKCTEQLSAEPGFHDAKIKLSDGDGECYSNKIQLHIERSPQ